MKNAEQLRTDLAFVDRMIAECQEHLTRLKKTTAEMSRDGQDTSLARDVLASFAAALTRHEAERKLLVSQFERLSPENLPAAPPARAVTGAPPSKGSRRTLAPRSSARRRKR